MEKETERVSIRASEASKRADNMSIRTERVESSVDLCILMDCTVRAERIRSDQIPPNAPRLANLGPPVPDAAATGLDAKVDRQVEREDQGDRRAGADQIQSASAHGLCWVS